MNAPDIRVVLGLCILVVALALAAYIEWPSIRRAWKRAGHWKHFRGRKLISDYAAHVQPHRADEYRIDVPTRSIP